VELMLAERGSVDDLGRLAAAGYAFDLKVDGIRALVSTQPAAAAPRVQMTTRLGADLTVRFPELRDALLTVASERPGLVLDTEVAVPDERGLPSWPLTQQRTAQRSGAARWAAELPARLYVFDLLGLDGEPTTGWTYDQRRDALEQVAADWTPPLGLTLTSVDPWPLWEVVTGHGLEGVIAKRRGSRYRRGRSADWVKIKTLRTVSCLVGGVDWGPAADLPGAPREYPRALDLYLLDADGELRPMGRVGASTSDRLRRQILDGLRRPPLIVEIEYASVTAAGRLRQPVLRQVRTDVGVLDCGMDQLAALDGSSG
jgi:bifunctional non-homologous end joining protein LigD